MGTRQSRLTWYTRDLWKLSSASHSLLLRIQHASHRDAIKMAVPSAPIFLLGFWRSGTTFLHELFCCDPRFGFPSTYACLNPSHFLLTERWVRERGPQQQTHRPMDNMRYSWASPQEDEFALLALGAPSAYDALLVPSLMLEPRSLLDLREHPRGEQDRWKDALLYFLRLLTVQQGKTIVLKSPSHGFKLPILPSMFPEARYVIIERNPYEVFASNLKLWRTLFDMYSLESYVPEEIDAFVLAAYVMHEEAISEGSQHLSPRSLARVRYEDLVADPLGQMRRLYEELAIGGFDAIQPQLMQHLAQVADHKRNSLSLSLDQKLRVDALWGELISKKKYGWPNQHIRLTADATSND
jgi:hypothetical protein